MIVDRFLSSGAKLVWIRLKEPEIVHGFLVSYIWEMIEKIVEKKGTKKIEGLKKRTTSWGVAYHMWYATQ
jgi:hypothetical protein